MTEWTLECGACNAPAEQAGATVCGDCGRPLLVRYDLEALDGEALREAWASRRGGMWRFREIMPLRDGEAPVTLGEGATPLLELDRLGEELGLRLYAKDEGQNPTGSFKDRGLSAAVTRAVRDGRQSFVVPTAGNAGAALAAYCARAGVEAKLFMPRDTPAGVVRRCELSGADIERIDGLIDTCGELAARYAGENGAWNVSTLKEPYRIEGKKTMMLEIALALGWQAPDAIVYPTGGGTGLIGSWKALAELEALGLTKQTTRLYSVQSAGCAPIVRAFERGDRFAAAWEDAETQAYGLRVPGALGDFLILDALRASGGGALAVEDDAMKRGALTLGGHGLSASIEGGATLAAAQVLRQSGDLREGERVVLFNTAHSLTY